MATGKVPKLLVPGDSHPVKTQDHTQHPECLNPRTTIDNICKIHFNVLILKHQASLCQLIN